MTVRGFCSERESVRLVRAVQGRCHGRLHVGSTSCLQPAQSGVRRVNMFPYDDARVVRICADGGTLSKSADHSSADGLIAALRRHFACRGSCARLQLKLLSLSSTSYLSRALQADHRCSSEVRSRRNA